jgi:hypothetical protein
MRNGVRGRGEREGRGGREGEGERAIERESFELFRRYSRKQGLKTTVHFAEVENIPESNRIF